MKKSCNVFGEEKRAAEREGGRRRAADGKIVAQSCLSTTKRTGALVVPRAGAPCCSTQSSHPPQSLSLGAGVGVLARAKMEFEMEKCFTFCGTGSIERDYF